MRFRPWHWVALSMTILAGSAGVAWLASPAPGESPVVFAAAAGPDPFVPQYFEAPFPPVTAIETVAAFEAAGRVRDDESVLGLAMGGVARAYPVEMLRMIRQEAINDQIGDLPILVTWCSLCNSARVFERVVGGRTLTFRINGQLWKNNMVLEDLETSSRWSQLPGRAMDGPLAGTTLTDLPILITDWKTWRREYPDTSVGLLARTEETTTHADRYAANASDPYLVGLVIGGEAHAWTLDRLRKQSVVNDEVGGTPVVVVFDHASGSVQVYSRRLDGRLLTFRNRDGKFVEESTGSRWNPLTGEATDGPLAGERLDPMPSVISRKSRWLGFYPASHLRPGTDLPSPLT